MCRGSLASVDLEPKAAYRDFTLFLAEYDIGNEGPPTLATLEKDRFSMNHGEEGIERKPSATDSLFTDWLHAAKSGGFPAVPLFPLIVVAIICLVLFGCTLEGRGGVVLLNYLCLVEVGSTVAFLVWRFTRGHLLQYSKAIGFTVVAIPIGLIYLWASFDYYHEQWTTKDGWRVLETRKRWTQVPIERSIDVVDADGKWTQTLSGSVSASGKPHGEWHTLSMRDFSTQSSWFWYGEEISEGEWHLRDRK
ncbi:MAG: hypothetical protein K8R36_11905 [Planctomycetales bacterium]|nr:hypothetical protein [Planctomycetales bacterium]